MRSLFACAVCFVSWQLSLPVMAERTVDEVRTALAGRLNLLGNMRAEFDRKDVYIPPPDLPTDAIDRPDGHQIRYMRGAFDYSDRVTILDSKWMYYETSIKRNPKSSSTAAIPERSIFVLSPERFEELSIMIDSLDASKTHYTGSIRPPQPIPNIKIDVGMGLRCLGESQLLTTDQIKNMPITISGDTALVDFNDENQGRHRWTYDMRNGATLNKYEFFRPKEKSPMFIAAGTDFKAFNGIKLATRIVESSYPFENEERVERERTELVVKSIILQDPANKPTDFLMKWPPHSRVLDTRTKKQITVGAVETTLSDEELFERFKAEEEKKRQELKNVQDGSVENPAP